MQRNPSYNLTLQQIYPTTDDLSYEEVGPPDITNQVVDHPPEPQEPINPPGTKLSKVAKVFIAIAVIIAVTATVLAVGTFTAAKLEINMLRDLLPNTPNREGKNCQTIYDDERCYWLAI